MKKPPYSPFSQNFPANPFRHLHTTVPLVALQVPLFWHVVFVQVPFPTTEWNVIKLCQCSLFGDCVNDGNISKSRRFETTWSGLWFFFKSWMTEYFKTIKYLLLYSPFSQNLPAKPFSHLQTMVPFVAVQVPLFWHVVFVQVLFPATESNVIKLTHRSVMGN